MIVRKNMGRGKTLLMLLMVLGFLFATYNFVSLIIEHKAGGLLEPFDKKVMESTSSNLKYHVALTATDAAYSQWQCRIMYYWYKKVKDMPGSDMGKFTRILHSGKADQLMDEIPTFVVDPLPEGLDRGYIVLNRPWAFVQWLEKADIEEEYILMAEPDHIFVNPLPNLAHGSQPAGYPFFYIKPVENEKLIRKFYPEDKGPRSTISYIDGDEGILRYRGYPIEELAQKSTYMEVAYLIMYGNLPSENQLLDWEFAVSQHSAVPQGVLDIIHSMPHDAHPMGVLVNAMSALSVHHPDANPALRGLDVYNSKQVRDKQIARIIGKITTIAAAIYLRMAGRPPVLPSNQLSYTENFLYMLDSLYV